MVVNRDHDVVLARKLFDARQDRRLAGADDGWHSSGSRVVEVLPDALVCIRLEGYSAAADKLQPSSSELGFCRRKFGGRGFVREVNRLEVDVLRAERAGHLDRLLP